MVRAAARASSSSAPAAVASWEPQLNAKKATTTEPSRITMVIHPLRCRRLSLRSYMGSPSDGIGSRLDR
jgi:hypothetical protein